MMKGVEHNLLHEINACNHLACLNSVTGAALLFLEVSINIELLLPVRN